MSSTDLAKYIQERMKTLNLTTTSAAEQSGISRQTWHKLRQADIREAKLSTLIKVAETLHMKTPQLVDIYFRPTGSPYRTNQHYDAAHPW
jgi:transcriptional regulator with XRE-family HTH domain